LLPISAAFAHFPILIHDSPFAAMNQTVNLTFAIGHPFEQEYENAAKPESCTAILPSGKRIDLTNQLRKTVRQSGAGNHTVWKLAFQPTQKGDTVIALNTIPTFGRNQQAYQDFLKAVVHVERQDGWRERTGQPLEIVPLTRPYGLEEGMVFTAQLMKGNEPVAGAEVEIERFLPDPPKDLPPEPMITRVVVTDPNGVFSCTFPDPGWWLCAAYMKDVGKIEKDGETYTQNGLAGIWIHIEKKMNP